MVAGRIGDDSGKTKPYKALTDSVKDPGGYHRCDSLCSRDPSGDGYDACNPIGDKGITVWRQFASTPTFSFESDKQGFAVDTSNTTAPTSLSISSDRSIHGSKSMLATINATAAGQASRIYIFNSTAAIPGKNMSVYFNIPSGQNWSYVQAFVQDGPGGNYRWSNSGYNSSEVMPGEWSSIVVKVPSDFSEAYSQIGLAIYTTGGGTIKMYIDAMFFDS